ncbi:MAG: AraC family transcriptional regulator [Defluviitaleaceae bacterium]|nr:AraC family transcriptional regulator [Defluviitaleaceae bacterium]
MINHEINIFNSGDCVWRLLRFIEAELYGEIDAQKLARFGFVSTARLYRDFYSATGHSVKEYVRKRRLSNALALVKSSSLKFTEIAANCGYSSQQSLNRTVKKAIGTTPSAYKATDAFYYFPPYEGGPAHTVAVANETIPAASKFVYLHPKLSGIENAALAVLSEAAPEYTDRVFGRNAGQSGNRFAYELYLTDECQDFNALSRCGLSYAGETPRRAGLFASIAVANDAEKISGAWDYLYSVWLSRSMFEYTGEPYFEEFLRRANKVKKLRLFLPILKRGGTPAIRLIKNPSMRFAVSSAAGPGAEKKASRMIVNFLAAYYPEIVKTSREYYVSREADSFVCGIRADSALDIPGAAEALQIATEGEYYLRSDSETPADYGTALAKLLTFASENGFRADAKGAFAIYDAGESYDDPKMAMYVPVRIDKK